MTTREVTEPDKPRELYKAPDGILYTMDTNEEVTCSWTRACDDPATSVRQHPVLGGVPICTHHDAWVQGLLD